MTKEIFELVKKMDIQSAETQMAFRCAPFITGLKTSNLLILKNAQAACVQQLIKNTKCGCFLLYQDQKKAFLLLYDSSLLETYLKRKEVKTMLVQQGYEDASLPEMLSAFAARYHSYMQGTKEFPHEMGLFLGYPPEDVKGFIENKGKNFLCTGYWKVYRNAAEKKFLFQKFDQAAELLLRLTASGISLTDLLADRQHTLTLS